MGSAAKKSATKKKASGAGGKDYAASPLNQDLPAEDKLRLYRDMVGIRRFEERSLQAYNQGKIGGFLHLYIGQESVAVGAISVMGENDHMITAYRDHGHSLAVGMTMKACMAELFGKQTGCSKGKGGSMHFFSPEKRYWGGHGVVAGQTPLGAGLAFALKYKGIRGCALCFLGDGAINQGVFMETLNLVGLWGIPVVFVIENNGYSMGTSESRSSVTPGSLASRAEGFDIRYGVCEGHDIYAVREDTAEAMRHARDECRPYVLEIRTYRYRGHSVADANHEKYRSKEEIEEYKKNKDPIGVYQTRLTNEGLLDEDQIKRIDREMKDAAEAAAQYAEESSTAPLEDITADVYWEVDNDRDGKLKGTYFFND